MIKILTHEEDKAMQRLARSVKLCQLQAYFADPAHKAAFETWLKARKEKEK